VALLLGAVVAPPDAVAAVAIGRKLGLPRGAMTVLTGESLVNDASALTLYKVALAGIAGASTGIFAQLSTFVVAVVVGIAVGLVIGVAAHFARTHMDDTVLESVVGMVVPFACYLVAEELHGSGVLAVVAAGLYLGHNSPKAGFATRLQEQSVWTTVDVLLESLAFGLIGLELPFVLKGIDGYDAVPSTLVLLAVVIAVRVVFILGRSLAMRLLRSRRRPSWRISAVLSWTGMRGVVTLAAAAAIPEDTPGWAYLQLAAFVITVGTLLLQGISLPWLIRGLGVREDGSEEEGEELRGRLAIAAAALERIDELAAEDWTNDESIERVRALYEFRRRRFKVKAGKVADEDGIEERSLQYQRLMHRIYDAQRETLIELRDQGDVSTEVMARLERELDLEESRLEI
jgi:CPA1 family monovalent cation:H+ antiporter